MKCAACKKQETILWAHNGGIDTHRWDEADERDCICQPKPICSACDAPLLHEFGFIVLDAVCFGHQNSTMQ